jgi:hypothetical protein
MTQGEINAVNRLSRAFEAFNSDPGIKKLNKTLSGLGPKLDKLIALLERIVPEDEKETHVSMAQMREEHPEVMTTQALSVHGEAARHHIKETATTPSYLRPSHAVQPRKEEYGTETEEA